MYVQVHLGDEEDEERHSSLPVCCLLSSPFLLRLGGFLLFVDSVSSFSFSLHVC